MASFWNHLGKTVETVEELEGIKEDKENLIVEKYTQANANKAVCCSRVHLTTLILK